MYDIYDVIDICNKYNIYYILDIYICIYNIYIYIYIYKFLSTYLSTFYSFIVKCHRMILSKRDFLMNQLYFVSVDFALTKSVKTVPNLNHSKNPKKQLKVE